MATFELYRRSTIGMCLTETLDEMVSSGTLSPELAIQVLVQFDKSMTDALETQVKSKVTVKTCVLLIDMVVTASAFLMPVRFWVQGHLHTLLSASAVAQTGHLHTYRFCDNVWTFILTDAQFKNEETTEQVGKVKIVACDSKLLTQ
ncbi:Transcription initiation factor IIA subunit 2 [Triticum urartu]|uniref:Transcription initiation factor IIA subunit 2 n=1 Tax=Triticum urartu TaxID=4572 RepID=M7ZTI1_TRIUA|nr:Transcription initiation factor IIA subunit 2 [Triticum urartu]